MYTVDKAPHKSNSKTLASLTIQIGSTLHCVFRDMWGISTSKEDNPLQPSSLVNRIARIAVIVQNRSLVNQMCLFSLAELR